MKQSDKAESSQKLPEVAPCARRLCMMSKSENKNNDRIYKILRKRDAPNMASLYADRRRAGLRKENANVGVSRLAPK